jgi:hypothetical protein
LAKPYLKKKNHQKGLGEWLKVQALSSNPSTAKEKSNKYIKTKRLKLGGSRDVVMLVKGTVQTLAVGQLTQGTIVPQASESQGIL